ALLAMSKWRESWPLVVLCPASLRDQWIDASQQWLGISKKHIQMLTTTLNIYISKKHIQLLTTTSTTKTLPTQGEQVVIIASYDIAARKSDTLHAAGYEAYICDESHMLKSSDSLRCKALSPVLQEARRVVMLTGTPVTNKPVELFSQLKIIGFKTGTYKEFGIRYCEGAEDDYGRFKANGCNRLLELSCRLKPYMLRRTKGSVLGEMPLKRRHIVELPCTPSAAYTTMYQTAMGGANYKSKSRQPIAISQDGTEDPQGDDRNPTLQLFAATGPVKTQPVCDFLTQLFTRLGAPPTKTVIFFYHKSVGVAIQDHLGKDKAILIHSQTSMAQRTKRLKTFTQGDMDYAVLSIKTCATGLNLTECSLAVFAELCWTPGDLLQAEDRIHRIGQQSEVDIVYLVAKDTYDDHLLRLVSSKLAILSNTIDRHADRHETGTSISAKPSAMMQQTLGGTVSVESALSKIVKCRLGPDSSSVPLCVMSPVDSQIGGRERERESERERERGRERHGLSVNGEVPLPLSRPLSTTHASSTSGLSRASAPSKGKGAGKGRREEKRSRRMACALPMFPSPSPPRRGQGRERERETDGALAAAGTQKITFVGGEPTLVPCLPSLVRRAKSLGLTTMVVTNGTRVTEEYLDSFEGCLDWVGLSIESGRETVNAELGRGTGLHVAQTEAIVPLLRSRRIGIKLNTVVTSLNWDEDMTPLLQRIGADRWKVFKMLHISGENDAASDLLVSDEQFQHYLQTHADCNPVKEDNDDMETSYVMVDPQGQFFHNQGRMHHHGRRILDVGVEEAFADTSFDLAKLKGRKGLYEWRRGGRVRVDGV
ncbi:hypothetical protein KIPB_005581, partial [Kipferlia bialata]